MSDFQATTYNVRIELMNAAGEIIGTVTLDGANGDPKGMGAMTAGGICNYGAATGIEVANFLDALAADLRGAHPARLDS